MRKYDRFNIIGGLIILFFSISYYMEGDTVKAATTLFIAFFLVIPVLLRRRNRK